MPVQISVLGTAMTGIPVRPAKDVTAVTVAACWVTVGMATTAAMAAMQARSAMVATAVLARGAPAARRTPRGVRAL